MTTGPLQSYQTFLFLQPATSTSFVSTLFNLLRLKQWRHNRLKSVHTLGTGKRFEGENLLTLCWNKRNEYKFNVLVLGLITIEDVMIKRNIKQERPKGEEVYDTCSCAFICQNEQLKDIFIVIVKDVCHFYSQLSEYCDNPIFCLAMVLLYYFCQAYQVSPLLSDSINMIFTEKSVNFILDNFAPLFATLYPTCQVSNRKVHLQFLIFC